MKHIFKFMKIIVSSILSVFKKLFTYLKILLSYVVVFIKKIIIWFIKFLKIVAKYFTKLIIEIYKTLSYTVLALFKIFDFLINYLIKAFSYIIYGIFIMFQSIGKFTVAVGKYTYKYFLRYIGREIYFLFYAIYLGAFKILDLVFHIIPKFLFKAFSDFVYLVKKKLGFAIDRIKYFFTHSPNTIKEYFLSKWNNLSVVKHYRNKKERELEVLIIDKFGAEAERGEKKVAYEYLARNTEGKLIKGYFSALSKLDVHSYLLDLGFQVYEIKTNWWINLIHKEKNLISNQMSNKKLMFWLAQLSTYLKAGIPLTDSVRILSQQDKSKKYKKVYDSIVYELSIGESFSEALNKQNGVFPALLINMIKSAELTGELEQTLDDMSKYFEEKEVTRKQMISALTYPSIILIFAIVVITFMLVYIIPQFKNVYDSMGAELTGITLTLLNLSIFLKEYGAYLAIGILLLLVVWVILYQKVKAFRMVNQYIFMHLPVIGNLTIYNEINLFAKTFAVLNKNNILLTDSIDILSKITSNEFYKMIMYDTISNLLRGEKMSLSFKDNWAVPVLAYYMISTGEQTGELSNMLEKVSEHYQREQRALANTLKTLIEPILMVILAVVVGTIMVAVLVPMYSIGNTVLGA